ncbi:hypothetical protein KGEDBEEJ_01217 [Aeromonas hydrophila]|nr:hypothetical protein KBAHV27_33610 [Aeromonas hydrophila]CAD7549353.1 hypothetical protein KBAHV46_33670 [Aeromonas hydrophila]CAD7549386.1 hypothetical protein KBAHV42_33720 [Aeromonas hydrophila]CAD7550665.1 hypothetical protein KBAHV01_33600 [Aeromonas hydrophila]CAD7551081.1 hypothetical protein KBAHV22_33760 [Aeromonas hydrophila]
MFWSFYLYIESCLKEKGGNCVKHIIFAMLSMVSFSSFADSTINLNLSIINQDVSASVQGVGASVAYQGSDGLIRIRDNYPDFDNFNIMTVGNQQGAQHRWNSLFGINLVGVRYGHRLSLKGKLIGSSFGFSNRSNSAFTSAFFNSGCLSVSPQFAGADIFEITASVDVNNNCTGATFQQVYTSNPVILTHGIYREFVFSLGDVLNSSSYKKLPPDEYKGTTTYNGDGWLSRVPRRPYQPNVTMNMAIEKKPFFSGMVFSDNAPQFSVINVNRGDGLFVEGSAAVLFNLIGVFSASDRIKFDLRSINGYKLTSTSGSVIPYSVNLLYRGVENSLVIEGVKRPPVIITPGLSASSINGELSFEFKSDARVISSGLYNDNLTVIAELVL